MSLSRIPFLSILGVPVAAAFVAIAGTNVLEGQWQDAVGSLPGARTIDLSTACAMAGNPDEGCVLHSALELLLPLAVVTAVIAMAIALVISAASATSGRNPYRVASIFRPVLFATIVAAIVLAVLDGILIIVAVWFGEPAITGYRHAFVALAAGAAVVVASAGVVDGLRRSLSSSHTVYGDAVTRAEEPLLWSTVDAVAAAVGTAPPDNIVLGASPEMFVTLTEVGTRSRVLTGRTLYLSLPMTRLLDQDELRAIIGHELGHFYGHDLEISARFYPIYGRAIHSLSAVTGVSRSEIVARVTLASAIGVLRYFLTSFAVAERAMARDRELLADRAGTHVSSPAAMASALVKITACTPVCERLIRSLPHSRDGAESMESLGDQVVRAAGLAERDAYAAVLDRVRLPHPTDTHPPLSVRLQALGTSVQETVAGGLSVQGAPAIALIPDATLRDKALTVWLATLLGMGTSPVRSLHRPASTGNVSIDSAWERPAARRAVELIRLYRGGSLSWLPLPRNEWVAIDDLLVGPQTDAPGYRLLATPESATGERWQVLDLADPDSDDGVVLRSGTRLNLVGVVNRGLYASTMDEIIFAPIDGPHARKLVSAGMVGRSSVHLGLAGALIVPHGDSLIGDEPKRSVLLDLIEEALDDADGLSAEATAPALADALPG